MIGTAVSLDDILIVNSGRVARTDVSILGRYSLANRRNPHGDRREYACRPLRISPEALC